jgi:hypothetical protein
MVEAQTLVVLVAQVVVGVRLVLRGRLVTKEVVVQAAEQVTMWWVTPT